MTYAPKTYRDRGGNRMVVAPGGELDIRGAVTGATRGRRFYVDTVNGSNSNDGRSWAGAFLTMAAALAAVDDFDVISFTGSVREQLVAPLGVFGVAIVGASNGRPRHDGGARWYDPASPVAGKALIEILEQGWEFHDFLMVPNATGAAIKAHRNEDATYPDSSHFILSGMKIVGTSQAGQIGVEDVGGNHHYLIENCEFNDLGKAITCSSTAIAVPLRNTIRGNTFGGNVSDVCTSLSKSVIEGNRFMTAGSGATNKVVSTTFNSAQGGDNFVIGNYFNNTEAQIAPGSGFTGAASDVWRNFVTDQADHAIGQPA